MPMPNSLPCLEYAYLLSCSLTVDVTVQVRRLDAREWVVQDGGREQDDEYFVTAQVFCGGFPMHALQQSTRLATATRGRVKWSQWLTPPVRYCDLQLDACVVVTAWSARLGKLGVGVLSLFDEHGRLRRGRTQVRLNGEQTETSRLWQIGEKYNNGKVARDPEVLNWTRARTLEAKYLMNPVEDKYRKLNPSLVRGVVDRDLKPNKAMSSLRSSVVTSKIDYRKMQKGASWRPSCKLKKPLSESSWNWAKMAVDARPHVKISFRKSCSKKVTVFIVCARSIRR
ncbi:Phosphatidylinositol 3-kinase catalytic subunit type 3 [Hondaea fermentalgiana]|uniref:Phosphatidylinositol 3-kinase catalytic subunit type 3 n=1 Tax=Hondaea fermentalgiana TaxID=2315210 RepID=A0A2R5GX44_9STRA|nr:Phosphatidylinositol 3-kinase catalytic subunit type 3 [Hondaea fermentalgiana]|eukprot:GBG32514.1 Phosphatidylinositol 3-kinase catalytic subunit type 3 [Hondaea fermentalgiana]